MGTRKPLKTRSELPVTASPRDRIRYEERFSEDRVPPSRADWRDLTDYPIPLDRFPW